MKNDGTNESVLVSKDKFCLISFIATRWEFKRTTILKRLAVPVETLLPSMKLFTIHEYGQELYSALEETGFPSYKHVLHSRQRDFITLESALENNIKSMYDIVVDYHNDKKDYQLLMENNFIIDSDKIISVEKVIENNIGNFDMDNTDYVFDFVYDNTKDKLIIMGFTKEQWAESCTKLENNYFSNFLGIK